MVYHIKGTLSQKIETVLKPSGSQMMQNALQQYGCTQVKIKLRKQ
jgi:hypothetical protein